MSGDAGDGEQWALLKNTLPMEEWNDHVSSFTLHSPNKRRRSEIIRESKKMSKKEARNYVEKRTKTKNGLETDEERGVLSFISARGEGIHLHD